jgi:hypothetical protein
MSFGSQLFLPNHLVQKSLQFRYLMEYVFTGQANCLEIKL